jgi:hypothetical protein
MVGFPGPGCTDEAEAGIVSGAGEDAGLGVGEAVRGDSVLSLDVVLGVAGAVWARAREENKTRIVAANTRRFIILESLPEYREVKATIYIDKDATRSAGVNCPR